MAHPTYDLSKEIMRREEARVAQHHLVVLAKKNNPAKPVGIVRFISQLLVNLR